MICSADYSISCPTICIHCEKLNKFSFDQCKFYYVTNIKSRVGTFGNITGLPTLKNYIHNIERFASIASVLVSKMVDHNVSQCMIEDYALHAVGKIFEIAEHTSIFKYTLWKNNIKFLLSEPTTIKKFSGAAHGGRANKEDMYEKFQQDTGVDLFQMLSMKQKSKIPNPISDICDSFYICKLLYNRLW